LCRRFPICLQLNYLSLPSTVCRERHKILMNYYNIQVWIWNISHRPILSDFLYVVNHAFDYSIPLSFFLLQLVWGDLLDWLDYNSKHLLYKQQMIYTSDNYSMVQTRYLLNNFGLGISICCSPVSKISKGFVNIKRSDIKYWNIIACFSYFEWKYAKLQPLKLATTPVAQYGMLFDGSFLEQCGTFLAQYSTLLA
jgi:hypothetical protein